MPLIGQDKVFTTRQTQQSSELLTTYFNEVSAFVMDVSAMEKYLEQKRSYNDKLKWQLPGKENWEFNLEPVEIITDETRVFVLTPEGKKEIFEKPAVKCFKGTFADGKEGFIRLTVHGHFLYAYINDGKEEYFVEPLRYYDHAARDGNYVFYGAKSVREEFASAQCHHEGESDRSVGNDIPDDNRLTGACYKTRVAFLADYLMYADPAHPGLDAVTDHVVGVINNTQSHYEYNGSINFDDGVNFEICELVVSTCSTCDPISSNQNPSSLLAEFSSWVDAGGFASPLQTAHLWSNRDFIGTAVGLAFQSTNLYCNNKGRAIFEDWTTTAALLKTMVSHEIGHNFNGVHDGTTGLILSPTVTVTDSWSSTSKTTISGQISAQNNCFNTCGAATCSKVNDVAVSNVTTSGFTVSWTATSQNFYTVKVREAGNGSFLLDFTTTNNSVTINPAGYVICKKYDVFVYNNCGANGLSAPVRALLISPTSQGCADFKSNIAVAWSGSTVTFTDQSLNATSWFWNFGNGQTSTLQNPTFTYTGTGSYDVSLTVNGVHTKTRTGFIRILPDRMPPYTLAQGGDFETNTLDFGSDVFEGTVNVWEFGTSSYVLATQGNAWKSYLNSDIPQVTSKSGLFSPRFNMTGYQNYTVHFDIGMETLFANGPVAAQLQYSVDNGVTWTRLGTAPDFYNAGPNCQTCFEIATQLFSDKYGWTLNQNYIHKSIDVSFLSGSPSVIFRFVVAISSIFTGGYNVDGLLIDNFRIDAQNAIPLPLDISSLKATPESDHVRLTWNSYNTDDIAYQKVYRSANGTDWRETNTVTNHPDKSESYVFRDQDPLKGQSYYKVGAVHFDGTEMFTNIAGVRWGVSSSVSIYPNPVHAGQPVYLTETETGFLPVSVQMTDRVGRPVQISAYDKITGRLDLNNPAAGVYFLRVQADDGTSQVLRLVLL